MKKENKTFTVFSITAPTGDVFVGMTSGDIRKRLYVKLFMITSLKEYIEEFGWENLEKNVIKESMDKEEAQRFLFETACFLRANGVLINKRLPVPLNLNPDRNKEYQIKWRLSHKEENKRRANEYYWNNREKCIERQIEYNRRKKNEKHTFVK